MEHEYTVIGGKYKVKVRNTKTYNSLSCGPPLDWCEVVVDDYSGATPITYRLSPKEARELGRALLLIAGDLP